LPVWLYVLGELTPLDIDSSQLLELVESPYRLFELIRGIVEECIGRLERVKPYRVYLDLTTLKPLTEYMVHFGHGELSIKIIHSSSPAKTLQKYYGAEGGNAKRVAQSCKLTSKRIHT